MVGQFANAIEDGDVDTVVALLTDDAWLTMPPYPYQYQGGAAIGNFLRVRSALHQMPLRLVPTRANGQPAFGCYIPCPQTDIARAYGLMVLTLAGSNIAEITSSPTAACSPTSGSPALCPNTGTLENDSGTRSSP